MPQLKLCLAALLLGANALPALAASSASSASSDSVSTSVGSISGSFEKSSESSTGDKKAAAGDYKVVEVAQATHRPGMTRMKLQAVAGGTAEGEFFLYLPDQAAQQSRVTVGQVVTVNERPYGFEFAKQASKEAFFLVVADDWMRELQTKVVAL